MSIRILSHERHVKYICVSKGHLCFGHGFFLPKRMQAIIVQNLHIINEYFKVKFVLSTTLVKDRGLGP